MPIQNAIAAAKKAQAARRQRMTELEDRIQVKVEAAIESGDTTLKLRVPFKDIRDAQILLERAQYGVRRQKVGSRDGRAILVIYFDKNNMPPMQTWETSAT